MTDREMRIEIRKLVEVVSQQNLAAGRVVNNSPTSAKWMARHEMITALRKKCGVSK